jgi:hypothetical protein
MQEGYAAIGDAREGGRSEDCDAWAICVSAGTTHANLERLNGRTANATANAGMCATWQIWHVASEEPGASVCQNPAPIANGKSARMAAVRSQAWKDRTRLLRLCMSKAETSTKFPNIVYTN